MIIMGEEEEKKKKGESIQGDKEGKEGKNYDIIKINEKDAWNGDRSNRGGSDVPRMWDYVFSVKLDEEEPLEKWNSITPFIEEFKRHKLPLSSNAIMFPLVQDYHWRINDGDKEYEIRREKKLKIYSKKVSAGAYSRFF